MLTWFTIPQSEKSSGTIKEQLADIEPKLEKLLEQKKKRIKEFSDIQSQIQKICNEISENIEARDQVKTTKVNENNLTLEKLEEFQSQLQELQKEKVIVFCMNLFESKVFDKKYIIFCFTE